MTTIIRKILIALAVAGVGVLLASPAAAIQAHGDPEGIVIHQLGHLFLVVSLALLIYWLRDRRLVSQTGWRYIQYAAFFLILWNLGAFLAHLLDEQLQLVHKAPIDTWHIRLTVTHGPALLGALYYLAKLDHLLCVPALWFLYKGLKSLAAEAETEDTSGESP